MPSVSQAESRLMSGPEDKVCDYLYNPGNCERCGKFAMCKFTNGFTDAEIWVCDDCGGGQL